MLRQNWNEQLINAARDGNLEQAIEALNNGADIEAEDEYQFTALHIACEKGYEEIVALLLDEGANIDVIEEGYKPISFACMNGSITIVQLLLAQGSKVGEMIIERQAGFGDIYIIPFIMACQYGHLELVRYLLENSEEDLLNCNDGDNGTPLLGACYSANKELVKLLLSYGALIDRNILSHPTLQDINIFPAFVGSRITNPALPDNSIKTLHKYINDIINLLKTGQDVNELIDQAITFVVEQYGENSHHILLTPYIEIQDENNAITKVCLFAELLKHSKDIKQIDKFGLYYKSFELSTDYKIFLSNPQNADNVYKSLSENKYLTEFEQKVITNILDLYRGKDSFLERLNNSRNNPSITDVIISIE